MKCGHSLAGCAKVISFASKDRDCNPREAVSTTRNNELLCMTITSRHCCPMDWHLIVYVRAEVVIINDTRQIVKHC